MTPKKSSWTAPSHYEIYPTKVTTRQGVVRDAWIKCLVCGRIINNHHLGVELHEFGNEHREATAQRNR